MTLTVRTVVASDGPELARIHARAWQAAYDALMSPEFLDEVAQSRPGMWERVLGDPDRPPVYAGLDSAGAVAGFLALALPSRDGDGAAEVAALNIDPDAWGQGIGTALMRAGVAHCAGAGYDTATLWVVEGNTRAMRFYERLGWEYDGGRTFHDSAGVSELHMRLALRGRGVAAG
jgi:ribosomal protein S18 acetylase RimI-like enzyme